MLAPTRRLAIGAILLALVVGVTVVAWARRSDDPAAPRLTVGWGGTEGHPSCRYDASAGTVAARIRVEGRAPRREVVTIVVTAYADENTSRPVGSGSRRLRVEGAMHELLVLTVPVTRPPHVGEDDESACRLDVRPRTAEG